MHILRGLLDWTRRGRSSSAVLDLGDGRRVLPEDLLDGHSARLLADRQRGRRTVPVQVDDDLSAAITVLAPDLAPLADLAEEVADVVPAVAPQPDFRRNLYEALERTHRQYRMQEALGTRPVAQVGRHRSAPVWIAILVTASVFAVTSWIVVRRKRQSRFRLAGLSIA